MMALETLYLSCANVSRQEETPHWMVSEVQIFPKFSSSSIMTSKTLSFRLKKSIIE